MALIQNKYS